MPSQSFTNHLWNAKPNDQLKKKEKKTFFKFAKRICFHFSSFWSLLLSNLITFLLCIHFKQFKILYEHHLEWYKSTLNSFSNRATYNICFGCLKIGLCNVWWLVFFEFSTPCTLGSYNFLFVIHFGRLLMCQIHQEEGFKFCLDSRNNGPIPSNPACPERLNVRSLAGRFTLALP
jgi:hypothetical protein